MGKYNFDEVIERRGTGALKTDALAERFGRDDLLSAWVADMDFATPDFIREALIERISSNPILGYTIEPADYKPSIIDWERNLHNWELKPEWLSYIPGIVKGIGMVINVFTKPGDDVVIMPPVYHPFRITAEENGRNVVNIPLIEDSRKRYFINFDALENLQTLGGVLLLSNPHNPGGRMWREDELKRLADICKKKGLLVVSDEIHADMALWGKTHVPFATVSEEAASNSITFCAPSKTFNIPGIVSSFSVVPDEEIRSQFYGWLAANEFADAPLLSHIATISAYRKGEEWRKEMISYVESNIRYVEDFCRENIPGVSALRPDASFLVWLDCRELGLSHDELIDLFVNKACVALNDGEMFGKEGAGMMRLNVAAPRATLEKVMNRIKNAVAELRKEEQ
ncbi:MAG: PatB family C-S lyase [Muribaculaceae bacterium]|nr:PatB family C-S lyase [Muribaculaceae bacterium]